MPTGPGSRPALSRDRVAALLRERYRLEGALAPLPAELDQNFRLETAAGGCMVVKVSAPGTDPAVLDLQHRALDRLHACGAGAIVPKPVRAADGEEVVREGPFLLRVLTWLEGTPWSAVRPTDAPTLARLGEALAEVDRCLADFRHPAMGREHAWDLARAGWIGPHLRRIRDPARRGIVERILLQHRACVEPLLPHLPTGVVHGDANDENLLLAPHPEGGWRVAGLLDFGDVVRTATVCEVAIACAYACLGADDPLQVAGPVVAGYHHAHPLSAPELHVLFPLLCLRLCVSVTASAVAAEEDPGNAHRQSSERAAWEALERLHAVDRGEAEDLFRAACRLPPEPRADAERWDAGRLLARRRTLLGPSLSLSYREPLVIARGRGQFLFDPAGRAYLDCVNNVPHVGHAHPRVAEAVAGQAAVLATNTRYLHPLVLEYAERLTTTLPAPLRVCYFVNSGSEANELAVRIAHTVTGRRDAVVLEGAYHGNTATLVELSPYKCEGPGGRGLPGWVHRAPKPDPYRGPHRGSGPSVGAAYAAMVGEICDRLVAEGTPPAFFMVEPILGCGGQVVLPAGYLAEAFRRVRRAGGLCVADEVQVGLGRVGTHDWAFETQGVVPDIVTMGKPLGNGHPLGAVVTTPEIAAAFANGMEYFSTFGGNPVSMAAGLAVLDVMEEEGLRERARRVGRHLAGGFRALAETRAEIGDVRGLGLFLGVELVRDRGTREPATEETARLVEAVKAEGILLSAEGPFHNVLKIKPPLAFGEADADALLGAVERALAGTRGAGRTVS